MITIRKNKKIKIILAAWTSDAEGNASLSVGKYLPFGYKLVQIQTVPGLNGDLTTGLPTGLYDVVINDEFDEDVASGELLNQSGTIAKSIYSNPAVHIIGSLTVVISNAGNGKSGLVNLYAENAKF